MKILSAVTSAALLLLVASGCSAGVARAAPPVPIVPAPVGASVINPAKAVPPPAGAASRRAAVEQFITGLIDDDASATYALLSDRERAGTSSAAWIDVLSELPVYRSFAVLRDDPVDVDATFVPRVDEEVGIVPAKAIVHFATIQEGGGWRVSLANTVIEGYQVEVA